MSELWGGLEAGGTKFVCAIGTSDGHIVKRTQFPTGLPEETLKIAAEFFRGSETVAGIGIGSFGPIDRTRGYITSTPKPGWRDSDIAGVIARATGVPVSFDTDVNAAALGEATWGAGRGLSDLLYLTVGTGIGGGAIANGSLVHGLHHAEMGHIRVPHTGAFAGICPYHGDCLEGLACGKALEVRYGTVAECLPPDHPGWDEEARLLAHGIANWIFTLSPQIVIVGGGVMKQARLMPLTRDRVRELLNGYVPMPEIVEPGLGDDAGVLGAIALALCAGAAKA